MEKKSFGSPIDHKNKVPMQKLLKKILNVEHGFKIFEEEAKAIIKINSPDVSKAIALDLLSNDSYQIRSLAIFILGSLAYQDNTILLILKDRARSDNSWQVQEIIAKTFDQFCKDNGYEKSLPVIGEWLQDKHPNVCRAVVEGLRIWTGRPYFNTHPQEAIKLISRHKASESEYLRKSVGNSLRDIAKKYSQLIKDEVSGWNVSDPNVAFTYKYVLNRGGKAKK